MSCASSGCTTCSRRERGPTRRPTRPRRARSPGARGVRAGGVVRLLRLPDLPPPGARIYYETHYAPLLQMQGSVREIAVELVRPDGSRPPALVTSGARRTSEGR